jgi:hypothetical protein
LTQINADFVKSEQRSRIGAESLWLTQEQEMKQIQLWTGLVAALALPVAALAESSFTEFETALRDAYGQYRVALFQSNTGNADATTQAMQALSEKWVTLETDWSTAPPPQYADDASFPDTLTTVGNVIAEAFQDVASGDLATAHVTLEQIRAEIGDLHIRNGILTFSDRMNAYHAKMEEVLGLDLTALGDQAAEVLSQDAAVLSYLAEDIAAHPAPEASDPAYAPLVDALGQSVAAVQAAARAGDMAAVTAAIGQLKAPYARLFAKFG